MWGYDINVTFNVHLKKITLLVRALYCLHNWSIDNIEVNNLPEPSTKDMLYMLSRGGKITY